MHRVNLTLLLVFLSNIAAIFGSKCEIVRFVNEKNLARKCCVLNKKIDDRQIQIFKDQGYVVLQDKEVTSICRNIEEQEKNESSTKKVTVKTRVDVGEDTKEKKIPNIDIHQFVDSSKRCPDGYVQDFKGNCVEPFE